MGVTKMGKKSSTMPSSPANNIIIIINSFLLCFLSALFFSLLWILPFFQASVSFSSDSIIFPTPTFVFILGNLIVVVLIGESKHKSSKSFDLFRNDVGFFNGNFPETFSIGEGDQDKKGDDDDDDEELEMGFGNCEELSKRADDFIARVNMQREMEGFMFTFCDELKTMKKKYRKKSYRSL